MTPIEIVILLLGVFYGYAIWWPRAKDRGVIGDGMKRANMLLVLFIFLAINGGEVVKFIKEGPSINIERQISLP